MKTFLSQFCAFAALGCFTLSHSQAVAETYRLTDLGTLPGQVASFPKAINNQGQVTGEDLHHAWLYSNGALQDLGALPGGSTSLGYALNEAAHVAGSSQFQNGGSIQHATLFRDGTLTDLGTLPTSGNYSFGRGINASDQVVGWSGPSTSSDYNRAFIWDAVNGMQDLGTPGYARARSINNAGQVTGDAASGPTGNGAFHAFIWDATNGLQDLGLIAGSTSTGVFINQNGHVAGYSTSDPIYNQEHAFLWDGTMKDLGALGSGHPFSDYSYGFGINIHDEVVGYTFLLWTGGGLTQVPFIYKNGVMSDLQPMVDASGDDYQIFSATAINDAGQITAEAIQISTNRTRAVLLTPNSTSSDTVTITRASYRRGRLTVMASDSDPTAVLQVFVTSTDTLIGTMTGNGTNYTGKFSWPSNPLNITVKSSLGGSASSAVTGR